MTLLSSPEETLKVSVVVPARNEEDLIQACLEALANQKNIASAEYEVILVLDNCTDATEPRAREFSDQHPDFRLRLLDGPGKGAGHARRAGMETACHRLLDLGKPSGLIASTDADTVVAPDWLSVQLERAARGARAIGGRIELNEEEDLPKGVSRWRSEQGTARHQNLLAENNEVSTNVMEHWQFSGASLSLTAAVYAEIGGLEPLTALEDEYLERVLRQRGVQIERPLAVKVRTSARRNGRAERGLAQDLALASWFHGNTYRDTNLAVESLLLTKRRSVSLILTGGCSPGVLRSLDGLQNSGVLDEVLNVGSFPVANEFPPYTAVLRAEKLMPDFGPIRGYGDLLWRGLSVARGEVVVVLDSEREDAVAGRICGLLRPLMESEDLSLVKGFWSTPDQLSELVARPLINLHRPRLAGFTDPLSRDFAASVQLLRSLPFPVGSGIDISLLLDAEDHAGLDALAQSFLGDRFNCTGRDDSEAAYAIQAAVASRTPGSPAEELIPGPLFLPGPENLATRRVPVEERPPLESLTRAPV